MANRTLKKALQLRLPDDVKEWIEVEAAKNSCSQNSEIIRAIRERMDRSRIEKRRLLRSSDEGKAMAKRMAKALLDAGADIEKNEAGGPCDVVLISEGFDADLIEALRNRTRFEFYELMADEIDCDDVDASGHHRWPEFAEYVA